MEYAHRLHRSSDDRMLFGVAGGMAEYFDIDPVLVRLAWVALTILSGGVALLVYIAMAFIVPDRQTTAHHSAPGSIDEDAADEFETEREGERDTERRRRQRSYRRRPAYIGGVALVVVGAVFLLSNLGLFGSIRWDIIWPVALIAIGLAILVPRLRG